MPRISLKNSKKKRSNLTTTLLNAFYPKFSKLRDILMKIHDRSKNDPNAKFDNLYSLLYNPSMLVHSLGNLRPNKGSATPGVNDETLQGINFKRLESITSSIKENKYKFSPFRRHYVPKPGKKKLRPLGIPNFSDRLVQDSIRIVLEAIYEPEFSRLRNQNYGFRPSLGTHDAIKFISRNGTGCNYAIEGDIVGAYDNVNINILMNILRRKIIDRKFLALIRQGCYCGLIEFGKYKDTFLGVPQGGIASPLLFNIYMHEFDSFINNRLTNILDNFNRYTNRNSRTQKNPQYTKITYALKRVKTSISSLLKGRRIRDLSLAEKSNLNEFRKKRRTLFHNRFVTYTYIASKRPIRIVYCRYADDWILLVNSNLKLATSIKRHISRWLKNNLKFELSEEKTHITNIETKYASFLGFNLFTFKTSRRTISPAHSLIRTGGYNIKVGIDMDRVLNRLYVNGFCRLDYFPSSKFSYTNLSLNDIITKYNQIISGLCNYYIPVTTQIQPYGRIHYILEYSCYFTIAQKLKTSTAKLFKRFGPKRPTFTITQNIKNKKTGITTSESKRISVIPYLTAIENAKKIKINPSKDLFSPMNKVNWRTYKNLKAYCVICGTRDNIEWHHVNSIRTGRVTGFTQIMKQINRKQIPLCHKHHVEVTKGLYDNFKLSDLVQIDYWLA